MPFLGRVDHESSLSCSSKVTSEDKLLILVTFLAHPEKFGR